MRRVALACCALLLMAQGPPAPPPAPTPTPTPAPAPEPAAAPPSEAAAAPAQQELIYHGEASSLLGRTVRDLGGTPLGRIVDVLVDDAGLPRAAVVDVGGFMGMGVRRVAVTWRALHFDTAQGVGRITFDMTLDQIKDVPEYKRLTGPADPPVAVAVPPKP